MSEKSKWEYAIRKCSDCGAVSQVAFDNPYGNCYQCGSPVGKDIAYVNDEESLELD